MRQKSWHKPGYTPIPEATERIGKQVLDAAFQVHKSLGPGFVEKMYEEALCIELNARGIGFVRQKPVQVFYRERLIGTHRLDLLVEDTVIVEIKAVEKLLPVHEAQLISYLTATGLRLGYLLNFNSHLLKNGIQRIVR